MSGDPDQEYFGDGIAEDILLAMQAAGDLEGCISECNEALSLDGNCAHAHGLKGSALVFAGRREEGRASLRTYLRLNPRDPARAARLNDIVLSHYLDGDYELAAEASRDAIRRDPSHVQTYRWLLHPSDSLADRPSAKC